VENVRLFTELQEKNRALTTAHAQFRGAGAADGDGGDPARYQPVADRRAAGLDTIVRSAVRL